MEINGKEYSGLTTKEVNEKIHNKQRNIVTNTVTKSYKDIFLSNTVTFFNIINAILLFLVVFVGSYKNTLFIFIIVINTCAGIFQEIKAKRMLDRLSILTTSKIDIIRDGILQTHPIEDIVVDDILLLLSGQQIPADSIVIDGQLEVNESLLTGESDGIEKESGDTLYSGSFVTSGKAICQVQHVGDDNYMQQLTKEAKAFRRHPSELNRNLNRILKVISIIIVPLGGLLFLKQFYITESTFQESVISTVAAVLGMIPEGLVLLTSMALTISVMRLAKQKTLVQELYCIETLARVDTLCLDKTGTITEGKMVVEKVDALTNDDIPTIMGNVLECLADSNVTSLALQEYFNKLSSYTPHYIIPFSSERKYSAVSFEDHGTYYVGAMQSIFPNGNNTLEQQCQTYSKDGYRVLVLGYSPTIIEELELAKEIKPIAIIVLSDVIRKDAKETLDYFAKQGVQCKVISGDDPITVASIAKRAGFSQADQYIDASTLTTPEEIKEAVNKYHIFGRVTPKQKKEMILSLKDWNHTVAMTGDGVNDVLAFKEADCSIAMASGSDAAKRVANLVLLDNNFNAMPHIVNEGRRVINNIEMSSSMFLIKTIFSVILATGTILLGQAYPFTPIQLSIINGCCVGIPTFLLAYEANFDKIEGSFLKKVVRNAFPSALTIALGSIIIMNVGYLFGSSQDMLVTICVLFTGWNYMKALVRIYPPVTLFRKVVLYASQILYFISMIIGSQILELTDITFTGVMILVAGMYFATTFTKLSLYFFDWIAPIAISWKQKFTSKFTKKAI